MKWFSNNRNATSKNLPTANAAKPPQAVNALSLFRLNASETVKDLMATKRANEGTSTQDANLRDHREILKNLYGELDDATHAGYGQQAVQENLKLKAPPGADHIDEYVWLISVFTVLTTRFQESITHFGKYLPCPSRTCR